MFWFYLNGRLVANEETCGADADRDRAFQRVTEHWDHAAECHNGMICRLYYRDGDGGRVRVINTTVHTTDLFHC